QNGFPERRAAIQRRESQGESRLRRLAEGVRRAERRHAGTGRPRMAARTEALDRAHPRNDEAVTAPGEPGRRRRTALGGRPPRDRNRRGASRRPRCPLPRTPAEAGREMTMKTCTRAVFGGLCAATILTAGAATAQQATSPLSTLTLPAGFRADVFAEQVENARTMVRGPQGTIFVGSRTAGKVHAVIDRDGDYKADRVVVIASGL